MPLNSCILCEEQGLPEQEDDCAKIGLTSVLVDDQEKALRFYTDKLGFVKNADITNSDY